MSDKYIIKLDQIEIDTHVKVSPMIVILNKPALYLNVNFYSLQKSEYRYSALEINIMLKSLESFAKSAIKDWSGAVDPNEKYLLRIINTEDNVLIYHKILD